MDRSRRPSSATTKGLLSRQLASITDTLARASKRRDEEMKRSVVRVPASHGPPRPAFVQLSGDVPLQTDNNASSCVPEGHDGQRGWNRVEAFKRMMAEVDAEEVRREEEEDNRSDVHQRWADAVRDAEDAASDEPLEATYSQSTLSTKSLQSSAMASDLSAMLAELRNLEVHAHATQGEANGEDDGRNDIRSMLAELESLSKPATTDPFVKVTLKDSDNNPRQKLAELTASSMSISRGCSSYSNKAAVNDEEEDSDIDILRARLQKLRSSSPDHRDLDGTCDGTTRHEIVQHQATPLHPKVIPYVVALQLEQSNTHWGYVQGWTTCLYGSDLNSYEAQKDKEAAVAKAEVTLKRTIDSTMEVEEGFRRKEEQAKLHRRLVVSNLAAGADEKALGQVFRKYRNDIAYVTFLPDRDPLKRTQTAYIDMASRKAAITASYTTGQIYGLIFNVKLAVAQEA